MFRIMDLRFWDLVGFLVEMFMVFEAGVLPTEAQDVVTESEDGVGLLRAGRLIGGCTGAGVEATETPPFAKELVREGKVDCEIVGCCMIGEIGIGFSGRGSDLNMVGN